MDLKETISKVPNTVWLVGGLGVVGILVLLTRGGGSTTLPGIGEDSDVTGALADLQDQLNELTRPPSTSTGGTTTPTPPNQTNNPPVTSPGSQPVIPTSPLPGSTPTNPSTPTRILPGFVQGFLGKDSGGTTSGRSTPSPTPTPTASSPSRYAIPEEGIPGFRGDLGLAPRTSGLPLAAQPGAVNYADQVRQAAERIVPKTPLAAQPGAVNYADQVRQSADRIVPKTPLAAKPGAVNYADKARETAKRIVPKAKPKPKPVKQGTNYADKARNAAKRIVPKAKPKPKPKPVAPKSTKAKVLEYG